MHIRDYSGHPAWYKALLIANHHLLDHLLGTKGCAICLAMVLAAGGGDKPGGAAANQSARRSVQATVTPEHVYSSQTSDPQYQGG